MSLWKRSTPQTYTTPEPPQPATAPIAMPIVARKPAVKPLGKRIETKRLELEDSKADLATKGFDPYNSGVFNRRDTWERVTRK